MLQAIRSFLALALLFAAGAALAAEIKPYVREDLASDVVRLTETLRKETAQIGAKIKGKSVEQLRKEAVAAVGAGNFKDASALLGAAIASAPKDAESWLALARLGAQADDQQVAGRYDMVQRAQTAAYAAYQRAVGAAPQADALALLGNLFARQEMWRPALDAYRASLDRRDDEDTRKIYEDLREKHGFRILDYKVDNESSAPRVCFTFSELLARKTDFAPYVAVAGAANAAISSEDQQICVEGLKHGERYAIVIREGLPSAVGELLLKSADYEIYVRDRSPQAHFAGKAYVLPRQGQLGAPLTTVNTAKVAIDVYRIGDRNLLAQTSRDDFLKPITASRAGEIELQDGVKVWSGSMDVASELNKDVVTDFPIVDAVGKLQPGVYLVTARPSKGAKAPSGESSDEGDDSTVATQWMVVSDLGLTTFSGDDGLHASVRSLATAAPLAGVEVRLVARNNEVLASKTTGPDGRVDFDPGLSRGDGGSAPSLVVATLGDDYGFLNLTQNAFDLTDRGVSGRDAPACARRVPLYRARRLSLRRDGVRHRVAARRQGRSQRRSAADARRQASRRRRIQARDRRRSRTRRPRFGCAVALRRGARHMGDRRLRRSQGGEHRARRIPARGLCPRAPRFHGETGQDGGHARRADRLFARRKIPLWRAGGRPRRHRRGAPGSGRGVARSPAIPATSAA